MKKQFIIHTFHFRHSHLTTHTSEGVCVTPGSRIVFHSVIQGEWGSRYQQGAMMEAWSGHWSAGTKEPELIRDRQTLHHPGDSHVLFLSVTHRDMHMATVEEAHALTRTSFFIFTVVRSTATPSVNAHTHTELPCFPVNTGMKHWLLKSDKKTYNIPLW